MRLTVSLSKLFSLIPSLALAFMLAVTAGCDSTTEPTTNLDPKDTTKDPSDTSSFRITAVSGDSLYGGETAELTAIGMGADIAKLRLIIHSIEARLITLEGERLVFEIPKNAQSGRLRLYRGDTLAAGDFSMFLYGGSISEMRPLIFSYSPGYSAYVGETVTILGSNFPMRRRDLDIKLGQVPVEIVSHDSTLIRFKVPAGAQTGELRPRMFGKLLPAINPFTVLQHGGAFLPSTQFSNVIVEVRGLNGTMEFKFGQQIDTAKVTSTVHSIDFDNSFGPYDDVITRKGDSVILEMNRSSNENRMRTNIRLKLETDSNFASGVLECWYIVQEGKEHEAKQYFSATVKGMRWKSADNGFAIYSVGSDIEGQLLSLAYQNDLVGDFQTRILQYDGGATPIGKIVITVY